MKTIRLILTVAMVLVVAGTAQAATITYLGVDTTTDDAWRSTGVTKTAAYDPSGDNVYGTDGYWMSVAGFLADSVAGIDYITSVTTPRSTHAFASYLDIDHPTNAIAAVVANTDADIYYIGPAIGQTNDFFVFVVADSTDFIVGVVGDIQYNTADNFTGGELTQTSGGSVTSGRQDFGNANNNIDVDYYFFKVEGASVGNEFTFSFSNADANRCATGGIFFEATGGGSTPTPGSLIYGK